MPIEAAGVGLLSGLLGALRGYVLSPFAKPSDERIVRSLRGDHVSRKDW